MSRFLGLMAAAVCIGVLTACDNPLPKPQVPAVLAAPIPYLDYASPANANGSFESPATGEPEGWTLAGPPGLRWERDGAAAHSGSKSMLLRRQKPNPDIPATVVSSPVEASGGDVVKFSAWVLGAGKDATQPPEVYAEAFAGGQWLPIEPRPFFKQAPAGAWFPLAGEVVVPAGAGQVRLVASAGDSVAATETVWRLDDFHCSVVSLRAYVNAHRDAPRLPDVLLAGVDTLRQSALGCYGAAATAGAATAGAETATPTIDGLAAEGILVAHVATCAPWTRPSFASIFTSLYPSQHTAELHSSVLPDSVTTLAELLQKKGYFTAAFAKTRFDGFVGPGAGFAKGFDLFFHSDDENVLEKAFDSFLEANSDSLSSFQGGGLFIFRHYFEPHATYENRRPDAIINKGLLGTRDLDGMALYTFLYPQQPGVANSDDVDYARRIQESEAVAVDARLRQTLDRFRGYGLYDRLNVVLCSDHGESFNERPGAWNHGNPYNTTTEVPLIMRLPGRVEAGTRFDGAMASNADIMPTILDLADVQPPQGTEGKSLLQPDRIPANRIVVSEDRKGGSLSVRNLRYKLVAMPASLPQISGRDPYEYWKSIQPGVLEKPVTTDMLEGPRNWVLLGGSSPTRFELYDLETDPFERRDISKENPAEFRKLLVELIAHCVRTSIYTVAQVKQLQQFSLDGEELARIEAAAAQIGPIHAPAALQMAPDTEEQLRNLGYLNP